MDRKMDPQKIDFWRLLDRDGARGGGSLLASLGLKLTNSNSCSARLAPRRGRRIEDALRQATAAPLILAWLSLWVVGGLCVVCPSGRFVIRQGLGRSWQVLGRMSGISTKSRSKASETDTQSGPRPAKRTPKAIKMRPCVFGNAFGARSAPRLPTGSCATTFWTSFCSQMGTHWGSIFGPGLTSSAS